MAPREDRWSAAGWITKTTGPIQSATGSRMRTSTDRLPPGVEANQMSPRCISPIRPVVGRAPIGDLGESRFRIVEGLAADAAHLFDAGGEQVTVHVDEDVQVIER